MGFEKSPSMRRVSSIELTSSLIGFFYSSKYVAATFAAVSPPGLGALMGFTGVIYFSKA